MSLVELTLRRAGWSLMRATKSCWGSSMLNLNKTLDTAISIESATARLTETILGNDSSDLAETLKTIAPEIGVSNIAYLRLSPDKSPDMCLLVAVVTYSRLWQHRYFVKKLYVQRPGD